MEQNLPKCTFCERNTKYICIKLCNICAVSASPTKEGYSEENKTVGLCKKCNDSNSLEVIVQENKKSQSKKQTSIFLAFKLKPQERKTPSSSRSDTKQVRNGYSFGFRMVDVQYR